MVEIGMAGLDTETGEITCELDRLIRPDDLRDLPDTAWVYENSEPPITPEMIAGQGAMWRHLRPGVVSIIGKYDRTTAYNRQFDLQWLGHYQVDVPQARLAPCPMLVMTDVCRLPPVNPRYIGISYKWPTFEEAWLEVFGTPIDEPHRAYKDAELEAKLIYEMIQKEVYHV